MSPKVSVVIPAYNRSDLLGDAIRSCYRSSVDLSIEIIVVDDCSPDDITTALSGFDVRYIRLEENSGSSVARNRGVQESTGDFIKFLDSDDVLIDGSLNDEYEAACNNESDIVVSGWQEVELRDDKSEKLIEQFTAPEFEDIVNDLLKGNAVPTSSSLYRASVARQIEWDPSLSKLNDWDYFVSAALVSTKIFTLPSIAYRWRQHSGIRIINTSSFLKNAMEFFRILEKLESKIRLDGRMDRKKELRLAQYLYKELRGAYRFDPKLGTEILGKIIQLDPDFQPRDEERSRLIKNLCRVLPLHFVLSGYGKARRLLDAL